MCAVCVFTPAKPEVMNVLYFSQHGQMIQHFLALQIRSELSYDHSMNWIFWVNLVVGSRHGRVSGSTLSLMCLPYRLIQTPFSCTLLFIELPPPRPPPPPPSRGEWSGLAGGVGGRGGGGGGVSWHAHMPNTLVVLKRLVRGSCVYGYVRGSLASECVCVCVRACKTLYRAFRVQYACSTLRTKPQIIRAGRACTNEPAL